VPPVGGADGGAVLVLVVVLVLVGAGVQPTHISSAASRAIMLADRKSLFIISFLQKYCIHLIRFETANAIQAWKTKKASVPEAIHAQTYRIKTS
jgi:hypothetical protein